MKLRLIAICTLLVLMAVSMAAAGTQTVQTGITVPNGPMGTTYTDTHVAKFNSALGTLTSIDFILTGNILGSAQAINNGADPAEITMNLASKLTLRRADHSSLVTAIPIASVFSDNVEGGRTIDWTGLQNSKTNSWTSTLKSDLDAFTGPGEITLEVLRSKYCSYTVIGENVQASFSPTASADVTIRYNYEPVPEPSGLIAMISGLGSLVGLMGRKRRI